MDRQTRREYFERLCDLRDRYGRRGPEDTTSAIGIERVIARASRLLERPASPLVSVIDGRGTAS